MQTVYSLIFWTYFLLSCAVLFFVALTIWCITSPFDSRRTHLHAFSCWWGFHYLQLWPFWDIQVAGREHLPDGPALLVPNHQSLGDILLLYGLKSHFKWVSKSSVFRIPFIGWNMKLNRYVGLERGDRKSVVKMLQSCREHLRNGSAILMFPEGTRSRDGALRAFKPGAFSLARSEQVPIIPIVLDGTYEALPKKGFTIKTLKGVTLKVHILPPVRPEAFPSTTQELSDTIRNQMAQTLETLRANTP